MTAVETLGLIVGALMRQNIELEKERGDRAVEVVMANNEALIKLLEEAVHNWCDQEEPKP